MAAFECFSFFIFQTPPCLCDFIPNAFESFTEEFSTGRIARDGEGAEDMPLRTASSPASGRVGEESESGFFFKASLILSSSKSLKTSPSRGDKMGDVDSDFERVRGSFFNSNPSNVEWVEIAARWSWSCLEHLSRTVAFATLRCPANGGLMDLEEVLASVLEQELEDEVATPRGRLWVSQ